MDLMSEIHNLKKSDRKAYLRLVSHVLKKENCYYIRHKDIELSPGCYKCRRKRFGELKCSNNRCSNYMCNRCSFDLWCNICFDDKIYCMDCAEKFGHIKSEKCCVECI